MDPRTIALLRVHDSCHDLTKEELARIADEVEMVELASGQQVHEAGHTVKGIYIVVSGRLKITAHGAFGKAQTVRFINPGDQFGSLLLVTEEDFPLDVVVEDDAMMLVLPRERVHELLDEIPVFRRNLLRKLGAGVQDMVLTRQTKHSVARVVLFIHTDRAAKQLVIDLAERLAELGEKVGILGQASESRLPANVEYRSLPPTSLSEAEQRKEALADLASWESVQRIFIILDQQHSADDLVAWAKQVDLVFGAAGTENFEPAVALIRELVQTTPSWQSRFRFIWLLGDQDEVAPLVPDLGSLTCGDFKVGMPGTETETLLVRQGSERLVHFLRGVQIGLALSGGAAHGMAHLGVLQSLDEAGIAIDHLSGASAGVLTGVVYGSGMPPHVAATNFANDLNPGLFFKWLPQGEGAYLLEKYRTGSWDPMLRKYLHDWQLEQLLIPVSTVTTDLIAAESVTRTKGDAVHSILESINLPVLSPPICRDGRLLVDGGILNNLPADVLVRADCNFVLGVDVSANIEHRVGDNDANTPTEQMKSPNVLTTLLRCFSVQAYSMSDVGASAADLTVAPNVSEFDLTDFTQACEMAEVGYQATQAALPQIRSMLHELDAELFPATDAVTN